MSRKIIWVVIWVVVTKIDCVGFKNRNYLTSKECKQVREEEHRKLMKILLSNHKRLKDFEEKKQNILGLIPTRKEEVKQSKLEEQKILEQIEERVKRFSNE